MNHKKPWIAFALSLILPGAGLCYLDRWVWGLLNFVGVQLLLIVLAIWPFDPLVSEYYHYIVLALAAASAGVAHAWALRGQQGVTLTN